MNENLHCVVLGSTSFAGSWFMEEALKKKYRITGFSRSLQPPDIFLPYKKNKNIDYFDFYPWDINKDTDKIIDYLVEKKPAVIVDFAGQGMVAPSWEWPEQWYNTNITSKVKIHNALRKTNFSGRYIRISTPEVYGSTEGLIKESTHYSPSTPYAVSHAAIDMSLMTFYRQFGFPVIFTRFANFYGSHQQLYRITPRAIYCAITKEILPLHGGGSSVRAFIHGKDVAHGILKTIEYGKIGEIYHFSTDEFITIKELVEKIANKIGVEFDSFVKITNDRLAKDPAYFMDSSKAQQNLGWKPEYNLDSSLQDTYEWIQDNIEEIKNLPKEYIHKE